MGAKLVAARGAFQLALYRLAGRAAGLLPLRGRLAASLAGRHNGVAEWIRRSRGFTPRARTLWFHAASVGEALVAVPVVRRIRASLPDVMVVLTHSSPSLESWPDDLGYDATGYAPPEEPRAVAAVFDAIRPGLLVFSRADLWPELLVAAAARGVPVALIGGVVRPGSARGRWPVRSFLRTLLKDIRFAGAVSQDDAARLVAMGVPEAAVIITGDPRHDQVLERLTGVSALLGLVGWSSGGPALVAGSVEESDEVILFEALARVNRQHPRARVLVVPHDPNPATLARLAERGRAAGLSVEVLRADTPPTATCVLATGRGTLADLYAAGQAAYVGGGFRPAGQHTVIEPAAFGIPVMFGPDYASAADAARLMVVGGGQPIPRAGAATALADGWMRWIENDGERQLAGLKARGSLYQGAAGITARHLLSLLV